MTTPTRYTITLTPIRDPLGREPIQRLRAALKRLGRDYKLKCVRIREAQGDDQADSSNKVKP